jgi:hypothetical protein
MGASNSLAMSVNASVKLEAAETSIVIGFASTPEDAVIKAPNSTQITTTR